MGQVTKDKYKNIRQVYEDKHQETRGDKLTVEIQASQIFPSYHYQEKDWVAEILPAKRGQLLWLEKGQQRWGLVCLQVIWACLSFSLRYQETCPRPPQSHAHSGWARSQEEDASLAVGWSQVGTRKEEIMYFIRKGFLQKTDSAENHQ